MDEQWRDHTLSLALHKTMVYIRLAQTLNGPHFQLTATCNEIKLNLLYSLNVVKYAICFWTIHFLYKPYAYLYLFNVFYHGDYSIELVEERNVLVTSSSDCAVRLWTLEGQYIGKAC